MSPIDSLHSEDPSRTGESAPDAERATPPAEVSVLVVQWLHGDMKGSEQALESLKQLGDEGVEHMIRAHEAEVVGLLRTVDFFRASPAPSSVTALERFVDVDGPFIGRTINNHHDLLGALAEKDADSSIGPMARFGEMMWERAREHLKKGEDDRAYMYARITQTTIDALAEFSGDRGYDLAYHLYERATQPFSPEGRKLPAFLTEPPPEIPCPSDRILEQARDQLPEPVYAEHGQEGLNGIYHDWKNDGMSSEWMTRILVDVRSELAVPYLKAMLLDVAESPGTIETFEKLADMLTDDLQELAYVEEQQHAQRVLAEAIRLRMECRSVPAEELEPLQTCTNWLAEYGDEDYGEGLRRTLTEAHPELVEAITSLEHLQPPKRERERLWSHESLMVGGETALAAMKGADSNTVRKVDVILTSDDGNRRRSFDSIEDVAQILEPAEYERLRKWLAERGFEHLPVQVHRLEMWNMETCSSLDAAYTYELMQSGDEVSVHDELPEKIVPEYGLAFALETMDIGERLEIEYDTEQLEELEKEIGSGEFKLSLYKPKDLERFRFKGLDQAALDIFASNGLRKTVLRRFPRLGQLCEKVMAAGSVRQYVTGNYGEVYLDQDDAIRIDSIDLTRSPLPIHEQQTFLSMWNEKPKKQEETLNFENVVPLEGAFSLPVPEGFMEKVSERRLTTAIERRQDIESLLDGVTGLYRVATGGALRESAQQKITAFLLATGQEWPADVPREEKYVTKTLTKLGVHSRNPTLAEFSTKEAHSMRLMISADPMDILQASTGKDWTSCTELPNGQESSSLYGDVEAGTVIAYLLDDNDVPVARSLVRPGRALGKLEPAAGIERVYGDYRYEDAMEEALKDILKRHGIATGCSLMTYSTENRRYSDNGHTDSGVTPDDTEFHFINYRA